MPEHDLIFSAAFAAHCMRDRYRKLFRGKASSNFTAFAAQFLVQRESSFKASSAHESYFIEVFAQCVISIERGAHTRLLKGF